MADLGKTIILIGGAVAFIGVVILVAGKLGFRGLPGDVSYQNENVRFYFPVVTCIAVSILITLGTWIFRWISGR